MWFTENPWPPMAACIFLAMLGFGGWSSSRRNLHLGLGVFALFAAMGFFVVERLIVTETERVQARIVDLCNSFRNKDPATVEYFSVQATELRDAVTSAMKLVTVQNDLRITDLSVDFKQARTVAKARFRANATISVLGYGDVGRQPTKFEATFIQEQGAWKISQVERLNPFNDTRMGLLDRQTQ